VHHAKSLFEMKEAEQGRNVFEQLVTRHPKRYSLCYLESICGQFTSTRR
jgi:hypothetical protein